MDLTRLYNLTTPELREEAERLGVADTYAMSRGQLINAIRNKAGAPEQEGFLGKVFGFAKWALQAAGETSSGRTAPTADPVPVPATRPASTPAPSPREEVSPPPRDFSSENETGSVADTGPPSRPPAGVFSGSAGLFEEPFPTRTMARILAEQGHFKRSLAIYALLVRDEPGDQDLVAEANSVRAQARARRSHAPQ
jgi:hypothetical protein